MNARRGLLSRLLVSDSDLCSSWPARLALTVLAWLFVAWVAMLPGFAGPSFAQSLMQVAPFALLVWVVREVVIWRARRPVQVDRWREREARRG